jgi:hypothetical protein
MIQIASDIATADSPESQRATESGGEETANTARDALIEPPIARANYCREMKIEARGRIVPKRRGRMRARAGAAALR